MQLQFLKFDNVPLPIFKEVKGKEFVYFGEKNDFPEYLLRLYNNSAKHNALITGKTDYISGGGWVVECTDEMEKAKLNAKIQSVNRFNESLNELTKKIATDLSIFGGYYLQITWSNATGEIAEMIHVDFSRVRTNSDNSLFFVSDEWLKNGNTNSRPEFETFEAFNPNKRNGRQILFFKEYRAGLKTYCLPDYRGALNYIELDVCISEYHLNTINNGMFSSKLINLNSGKVSDEEEGKIEKMFERKFAGSKNAGKFMLSFNESKENEPSILDLSGTELDKHFDLLNKSVEQQILTAHKLTSGMLVGIKTEGQIGGRNELRVANEIFQNKVIAPKQKSIEEIVNYLYSFNDTIAHLKLKQIDIVEFEFSEQIISQNMTQEEIRQKLLLPPIQKNENIQSQQMLNTLNSLPPAISAKVLESMNEEELRSLVGLGPKNKLIDTTISETSINDSFEETDCPECSNVKVKFAKKLTDEEILKHFEGKGTSKEKFKIIHSQKVGFSDDSFNLKFALSNLEQLLIEELKKNSKLTKSELAEIGNVPLSVIDETLKNLIDTGAIEENIRQVRGEEIIERNVTDVGNKQIEGRSPVTKYKILYSYEERANVPAAKSGSRPLCKKLFEGGLFFTGEEIENISSRVGYSVFLLCGGWYTNPDTNKTTPYCRHEWRKNIVIEK